MFLSRLQIEGFSWKGLDLGIQFGKPIQGLVLPHSIHWESLYSCPCPQYVSLGFSEAEM